MMALDCSPYPYCTNEMVGNIRRSRGLGIVVTDEKILKLFSYICLWKTWDPQGRVPFHPWGIV